MPPRKLTLPDSAFLGGTARRSAPSAERNMAPILDLLHQIVPATGRALEIASGTGQHIAHFAAAFPALDWCPSDADAGAMDSIAAWVQAADLPNLHAPIHLDASAPKWGDGLSGFAHVQIINLLHLISDAEAGRVLAGVARALGPAGTFLLYGPFRREGVLTSEGDARFDASLRAQDPDIGYKDDGWVREYLTALGLTLDRTVEMPANNLAFVFRSPA
ncbi:MAG: DUF938 domain-containing protein [Albidovulum sp.]